MAPKDSSLTGGTGVCLERNVRDSRVRVFAAACSGCASLNLDEAEIRRRIETLVKSVKDDRLRSQQLFEYVWTMICVERGLLRVVRELSTNGTTQIVLEEVRTGNRRIVSRPSELDSEIEELAVQALMKMLAGTGRPRDVAAS